MAYCVLTVGDLHSSTVASLFFLASTRSFFTVPSLSYRAASALSLAKDLHYNMPIMTFVVVLPLTCLSVIRTRLTILSKLSARPASIHLYYMVHE